MVWDGRIRCSVSSFVFSLMRRRRKEGERGTERGLIAMANFPVTLSPLSNKKPDEKPTIFPISKQVSSRLYLIRWACIRFPCLIPGTLTKRRRSKKDREIGNHNSIYRPPPPLFLGGVSFSRPIYVY